MRPIHCSASRTAEETSDHLKIWTMGGVEVIIPPGVRVESEGFAFMGGFGNDVGDPGNPNAPVVRLTGFAMMGGVEVRVAMVGVEQGGFQQ